LWTCLDGDNDDDIVAMVAELCTLHHDVCYSTEVTMVTSVVVIMFDLQTANHFTVSHSVGEVTYDVSQWAVINKRNKSSDTVKSLLATSNTALVCSLADVRMGMLILLLEGCLFKVVTSF